MHRIVYITFLMEDIPSIFLIPEAAMRLPVPPNPTSMRRSHPILRIQVPKGMSLPILHFDCRSPDMYHFLLSLHAASKLYYCEIRNQKRGLGLQCCERLARDMSDAKTWRLPMPLERLSYYPASTRVVLAA